ncbi:hypothetical protein B0H66DRAFT_605057 [Apodospora peruviana]|uniref:Uncharacterized protein n=1 Tax=Apodospora peruviana TaxID=516989 RepID=A0AAE0I1Y0_9PEZI|nr:hypothetical protein B0H66DRAFT_605057 [Apodospora peruviana]
MTQPNFLVIPKPQHSKIKGAKGFLYRFSRFGVFPKMDSYHDRYGSSQSRNRSPVPYGTQKWLRDQQELWLKDQKQLNRPLKYSSQYTDQGTSRPRRDSAAWDSDSTSHRTDREPARDRDRLDMGFDDGAQYRCSDNHAGDRRQSTSEICSSYESSPNYTRSPPRQFSSWNSTSSSFPTSKRHDDRERPGRRRTVTTRTTYYYPSYSSRPSYSFCPSYYSSYY